MARNILAQMDSGTLGGTTYVINFENGGLVLEYNDAYPLPDEVKAEADAAIAGAVGEMPAFKSQPPTARHVFGDHRCDTPVLHFHLLHAVEREERDIGGHDDGVLPVVDERAAGVHRTPAFEPLARHIDLGQQALQGGPVERAAGYAAIVEAVARQGDGAQRHGRPLRQVHLGPARRGGEGQSPVLLLSTSFVDNSVGKLRWRHLGGAAPLRRNRRRESHLRPTDLLH